MGLGFCLTTLPGGHGPGSERNTFSVIFPGLARSFAQELQVLALLAVKLTKSATEAGFPLDIF